MNLVPKYLSISQESESNFSWTQMWSFMDFYYDFIWKYSVEI